MYEQFKAGKFQGKHVVFKINSTAHENIFDEVKIIATKPVYFDDERISFRDEYFNLISIEPKSKRVDAIFHHRGGKENRLADLPVNYEIYDIRVEVLTMADVDALRKWRSAEDIYIESRYRPNEDIIALIKNAQETQNIIFKIQRNSPRTGQ